LEGVLSVDIDELGMHKVPGVGEAAGAVHAQSRSTAEPVLVLALAASEQPALGMNSQGPGECGHDHGLHCLAANEWMVRRMRRLHVHEEFHLPKGRFL
jgi:hypothetical protein